VEQRVALAFRAVLVQDLETGEMLQAAMGHVPPR